MQPASKKEKYCLKEYIAPKNTINGDHRHYTTSNSKTSTLLHPSKRPGASASQLVRRLRDITAEQERLKQRMRAQSHHQASRIESLNHKLRQLQLAEVEWKKINAHFQALMNASVDHIYIMDQNGTILFSNDMVQHFGMQSGMNLVGKRLEDLFVPHTCTLFRQKLHEVINGESLVLFNHDKVVNNETWHFANSLFPIHFERDILAVGGICHDISHHKIVENQLLQAQKMEALGTLVAGVAHEINNPINLILFNMPLLDRIWTDLIPLIEDQTGRTPNLKIGGLSFEFLRDNLAQLISDMEMAAQRVVRIVSGLKDFSRKGNPAESSMVKVNQAVENATFLVGATLKKSKSKLSLDLGRRLPLLRANLQNLEQVIVNLIINADQAIEHENGSIHISTSLRANDNHIIIEVTDNGGGVNPKVADKIFDPFVTDRQADGGTGLGLSVSYNLVKALNGDITFRTTPNKGTTFTVALPTKIKKKRFKVMVVDDDRMFRELLKDALSKKAGSVVEIFDNGAEALIRLGSQPPDLLILDMFMPEIDGLGVCRAIKNELDLELTKVIIVTGFPDHPNLHEVARMGFVQVFVKPLDLDKFISKVQEILHGKSS
jgi:PAS domain S-box-containing protein